MIKVKVEKLQKSFGSLEVLKGIDLEVKEGEVVCLIGPSGSGKGTIVERLCEKNNFSLSISATTRKPREGEEDDRSEGVVGDVCNEEGSDECGEGRGDGD